MSRRNKKFVLHFCKNKECNEGWLDEDITNVKTVPPHWKYCKKCCKELGIDFNSQKPANIKKGFAKNQNLEK